jgi:GT2 family glycosyltransferase
MAGQRPPLEAYDADIIILSLNRFSETRDAIESAISQRGTTAHVTVLDQGSDASAVRSLIKTFASTRNFSLYLVAENLGVAAGRNLASSLGHGQFVVALDNDAVFAGPFVVANAVREFGKSPDVGAIGFNILSADGQSIDEASWGYPRPLITRFHDRFDTTTFVGAGYAVRRATWSSVGGFDSSFFFTWEEYDFCLKAIARDWRIRYDGSLAVLHKRSTEARIPWQTERTRYFVRNRLLIGRRWGASWLNLTPRMLAYLAQATLRGAARPALQGILAAFRDDPPVRRKMTRKMRTYLYAHETRYRGGWLERLRFDLLGRRRADF